MGVPASVYDINTARSHIRSGVQAHSRSGAALIRSGIQAHSRSGASLIRSGIQAHSRSGASLVRSGIQTHSRSGASLVRSGIRTDSPSSFANLEVLHAYNFKSSGIYNAISGVFTSNNIKKVSIAVTQRAYVLVRTGSTPASGLTTGAAWLQIPSGFQDYPIRGKRSWFRSFTAAITGTAHIIGYY